MSRVLNVPLLDEHDCSHVLSLTLSREFEVSDPLVRDIAHLMRDKARAEDHADALVRDLNNIVRAKLTLRERVTGRRQ